MCNRNAHLIIIYPLKKQSHVFIIKTQFPGVNGVNKERMLLEILLIFKNDSGAKPNIYHICNKIDTLCGLQNPAVLFEACNECKMKFSLLECKQ